MSEIASFIGERYADVRSLCGITSFGLPYAKSPPMAYETVFLYDINERIRCKISAKRKNVKYVYSKSSFSERSMIAAYFDPAILPFIAQNIMKMLSEADPKHYDYYQRRLAQYQSQIDSMLSVGIYMLKDLKALDLTGVTGSWIRAVCSAKNVVRPPEKIWESWIFGKESGLAELDAALDESERRGWLIMIDAFTPGEISRHVIGRKNKCALPTYQSGSSYFAHVHDMYEAVEKRMKTKDKQNKQKKGKKS